MSHRVTTKVSETFPHNLDNLCKMKIWLLAKVSENSARCQCRVSGAEIEFLIVTMTKLYLWWNFLTWSVVSLTGIESQVRHVSGLINKQILSFTNFVILIAIPMEFSFWLQITFTVSVSIGLSWTETDCEDNSSTCGELKFSNFYL